MEFPSASKRRKLNALNRSIPSSIVADLPSRSPDPLESAITTAAQHRDNAETNGHRSPFSSAKQRTNAVSRSLNKVRANDETPTKAKTLDPLRNQKTDATASTPAKRPSTVGIFKQFIKKAPQPAEADINDANEKVHTSAKKEGTLQNGVSKSLSIANDCSEESDDDSVEIQVRTSGRARRLPARYDDDAEARKAGRKSRDTEGLEASRHKLKPSTPKRASNIFAAFASRGTDEATSRGVKVDPPSSMRSPEETASVIMGQTRLKSPPENLPVPASIALEDGEAMKFTVQANPPATPSRLSSNTQTRLTKDSRIALSLPKLEGISFDDNELCGVQRQLMRRLTGKMPPTLSHLEAEYDNVFHLVSQTVTAGESNSMLLLGARGSGKTAVVNQVIERLRAVHADEFHVVRLNGFLHTDDKIALKEAWRQLGREMNIADETGSTRNFADTLTTLLALLSHPAEQGREEAPDTMTKSVIFVMDEFDLFASHPRQTLLYNLFDIAQSRKAPIAVLGLTTRIDIAEALEKRVKSRFSHRYVHFGLPKSFAAFSEACSAAINIDDSAPVHPPNAMATGTKDKWNAVVQHLFSDESFTRRLNAIYHTSKSISTFSSALILAASAVPHASETSATSIIQHFSKHFRTLDGPDSKIDLLISLSTLDLALLICAARLTDLYSMDSVSFVQVYEEYKLLGSKSKIQASASGALAQGAGGRVWSKDVAQRAWEHLEQCSFILPETMSGVGKVRVDIALTEIALSGVDLGSWERWCKEI